MAEKTYHSCLRFLGFSIFIISYSFVYKPINIYRILTQVKQVLINMLRAIQLSMPFKKQYDS